MWRVLVFTALLSQVAKAQVAYLNRTAVTSWGALSRTKDEFQGDSIAGISGITTATISSPTWPRPRQTAVYLNCRKGRQDALDAPDGHAYLSFLYPFVPARVDSDGFTSIGMRLAGDSLTDVRTAFLAIRQGGVEVFKYTPFIEIIPLVNALAGGALRIRLTDRDHASHDLTIDLPTEDKQTLRAFIQVLTACAAFWKPGQ